MEPTDFFPHRPIYLDNPWLVYCAAASDFTMFIGCTGIALCLAAMAFSRTANGTRSVQLVMAVFVFLCGLSRLVAGLAIWWPLDFVRLTVSTAGAGFSLLALYVIGTFARGVIALQGQVGTMHELRAELERMKRESI